MKNTKEFPFHKARRISSKEIDEARHALEKLTGKKRLRRGRPPKAKASKYSAISIRLHPKILEWAKSEAKKRGIGYQSVINEELLKKVA